jgi:hypothetical protein
MKRSQERTGAVSLYYDKDNYFPLICDELISPKDSTALPMYFVCFFTMTIVKFVFLQSTLMKHAVMSTEGG